MYTEQELVKILESLISLPAENEVVEFKKAENKFDDDDLGQYFSALSNEANLKSKEYAWLVFGIDNRNHSVTGSNYKNSRPALDAVKKRIADQTTARITFEEVYSFKYDGKRVVMFQIPAAPQGIPMQYKGHCYGRDGESLGALNIQEFERIRRQAVSDWSREIASDATIDDLDVRAIEMARIKFAEKYPERKSEMLGWSDSVFLDKAKITVKGKITNAAIVLLGKEESEALISPSIASIKWILKDRDGIERDYEIFHCPLLLGVDKVASKIRNLKYRYINPEFQTLFPDEVDTYDPYVIREALNNAIAHQDYRLCGQINLVEYEDRLVFSNKGNFIPGNIETVLNSESPEENYRNAFLANAMVNLKMVDTIGSGIRKMFTKQRDRLFPLPVYDIGGSRVSVTVAGKILDINYSNLLARNRQLSLSDIELLNRIQYGKGLDSAEVAYLRKKGLVEGRMPNIYISKGLATTIGKKIDYSKHKGLDESKCVSLLVSALTDHKIMTRAEVFELLVNVLPDVMSNEQKVHRVDNLLKKLKRNGVVENTGRGRYAKWYLVNS